MPIGIVCEYDPFHEGHAYQIRQAREMAHQAGIPDDRIVAVMSGNYVQRGLPSIVDKYQRTRMALSGGVSLVVELPTFFSTSSAETFAFGAISLMAASGIVDAISFGIEDASCLPLLERCAALLSPESPAYRELLRQNLDSGAPFPIAREKALEALLGEPLPVRPNQILVLEYLKAMRKLNFHPRLLPVERLGASHGMTELPKDPFTEAASVKASATDPSAGPVSAGTLPASASAIRKNLLEGNEVSARSFLPESSASHLHGPYLSEESLWPSLQIALAGHDADSLSRISEIGEGLENRILSAFEKAGSYQQLLELIRSKRYPESRLRRILLHTALGICADDISSFGASPAYLRVLGCRLGCEDLLSSLSSHCSLPLLIKPSDDQRLLTASARSAFERELFFGRIYHTMQHSAPVNEIKNALIRL